MHNRIDSCFARLRAEKRKGFIPYICAGDPSLKTTVDLALALEKASADILELGIPFSDPLADGIVNQLAAQRALAAGTTVRGVLDCVGKIRARSEMPVVLYTYVNPIFQFGFEKFHNEAYAAGVDGLLILDLPPDEKIEVGTPRCPESFRGSAQRADPTNDVDDLIHIRLVAPTTPRDRLEKICAQARGFIYYVSREGVTGARDDVASSLADRIKEVRKLTSLPIAVGFGISTAQQAREVARYADAIVVGSAIVNRIAEFGKSADLSAKILDLVRPLIEATRDSGS